MTLELLELPALVDRPLMGDCRQPKLLEEAGIHAYRAAVAIAQIRHRYCQGFDETITGSSTNVALKTSGTAACQETH